MSSALTLGDFIVGGGLTSVSSALVGALFGRKLSNAHAKAIVEDTNANSARVLNEMSQSFATQLLSENRALRREMGDLENGLDHMREDMRRMGDRLALFMALLNRAIPILENNGINTEEYHAAMRNSL